MQLHCNHLHARSGHHPRPLHTVSRQRYREHSNSNKQADGSWWRQAGRQEINTGSEQICRAQTANTASARSQSAKEAVERGLVSFNEQKNAAAALSLFQEALQLSPSEEEARAATYNSACAHAKLKQWQPAADAVVRAINTYGESLSVALKACHSVTYSLPAV